MTSQKFRKGALLLNRLNRSTACRIRDKASLSSSLWGQRCVFQGLDGLPETLRCPVKFTWHSGDDSLPPAASSCHWMPLPFGLPAETETAAGSIVMTAAIVQRDTWPSVWLWGDGFVGGVMQRGFFLLTPKLMVHWLNLKCMLFGLYWTNLHSLKKRWSRKRQ